MDLKDFLPKTRREWAKWILDIVVGILFILMIYYNILSYREGFEAGVQYGRTLCFPVNTSISIP